MFDQSKTPKFDRIPYSRRKLSQTDRLLQHLKSHGSITAREALDELGVKNINATLYYLRQRGIFVKSLTDHYTDKQGLRHTSKQYRLVENPDTSPSDSSKQR